MPGYDGRGPVWGGGPGAGWGYGSCGVGRGWGRGFGRGFGRWFGAQRWTEQDELKALEEEEVLIKQELEEIQKAKQQLQSAKK